MSGTSGSTKVTMTCRIRVTSTIPNWLWGIEWEEGTEGERDRLAIQETQDRILQALNHSPNRGLRADSFEALEIEKVERL